MSQLFFSKFDLQSNQVIFFHGSEEKIALLHHLADETAQAGRHALVIATQPARYPIEGKVLVSDDTSLLMNLIEDEAPSVIWLASKVEHNLLMPLKTEDINELLNTLSNRVNVFIDYSGSAAEELKKYSAYQKALFICLVNFNKIRTEITHISDHDLTDNRKSSEKFISERLLKLLEQVAPHFGSIASEKKICFIDQIKSMHDENMIIPVARNLKLSLESRMIIGNVINYQIKEI